MSESCANREPRRGACEPAASVLQAQCNQAPLALFRVDRRRLLISGLFISMALLWTTFASNAGLAAEPSSEEPASVQSLDEQVQEIKSDVLAIAAELSNLEERLLYPSNTQIAIFVSFEEGASIALDSARIALDGELVAHHIYGFKELEALEKGGVQRIYTGNVVTGEHRVEVAVAGKRNSGKDFGGSQTFVFSKEVDPKLLGITLTASASGDAAIAIESW
ncbi:MAG: hypothetical protein CL908_20410 [Deltaproteobacteria bacterium]|jgi:hypothetical protein|nr:hypothetical protein [Deltaproteobacteria bacterium]